MQIKVSLKVVQVEVPSVDCLKCRHFLPEIDCNHDTPSECNYFSPRSESMRVLKVIE